MNTKPLHRSTIVIVAGIVAIASAILGIDQTQQAEIESAIVLLVNACANAYVVYARMFRKNEPIK